QSISDRLSSSRSEPEDENKRTEWPAVSRRSSRDSRTRKSSSTTATIGLRGAISGGSCSPGVSYWYLQSLCDSHQIGERCSSHLLHDISTMNLERDLTDAELCGSLLVQESTDDQRKNLPFAGREPGEALRQRAELSALPACFLIQSDSSVDRSEQLRFTEGFGQEIDGAVLHRAHG